MKRKISYMFFMLLIISVSSQLSGQENNLEKSFEKSCSTAVPTTVKPEKLQSQNETLEMLRQGWTIRGADNNLYQLEYFFPQLVSPIPFSFVNKGSPTAPKDFATTVVIPSTEASEQKDFDQIPSVDNLVKNSESGQGQGEEQGKQKQKQNQYQKGKGN
ncbi:MAG: hypothetical protein CVV42_17260 [Candidatus Riflebacteria bacterium HGW-Riflebacteria-2]|jgi:hypothetical protein|nr:MAG: hypothetical protein CVV42_17260 [Candidatus Riflebacteria bacterium HGW-Riflebacteria-2]